MAENKIVLINPSLAIQKNDIFTTGIVYMPVVLAYAASLLSSNKKSFQIIDAFAEGITTIKREGAKYIQGLAYNEILERIPRETELVVIYASILISHNTIINTINSIKSHNPKLTVAIMENSQAVSAYSLEAVSKELLQKGADFLLTYDSDAALLQLINALENNSALPKIIKGEIDNLDDLAFPDWEKFPLEKYWKLGYSHGPVETGRYLPLLTSRGCPYRCKFCVAPTTNYSKWRKRTALNVVSEMRHFSERLKVHEFHVEDLNPTVDENRILEICDLIIKMKLNVVWKLVSGTKAETIKNKATLQLMKSSGCNYISISPESGSNDLMKTVGKSFNITHGLELVSNMNKLHINSQACFILGFPGENKTDLTKTRELILKMVKAGVDEIAIFLMTPVPGSSIFSEYHGFNSLSDLTFSPSWRSDFNKLCKYRMKLYYYFLVTKIKYHPVKIIKQIFNTCSKKFKTKMEMTIYRVIKFSITTYKNH